MYVVEESIDDSGRYTCRQACWIWPIWHLKKGSGNEAQNATPAQNGAARCCVPLRVCRSSSVVDPWPSEFSGDFKWIPPVEARKSMEISDFPAERMG